MAALAVNGGPGGPPRDPHRRGSPFTLGKAALVGGLALVAFVVWSLFSAQIVSKRPNEMKTTQVILPPPPPPPPPPEVKPVEQPPEPTPMPTDQPQDTPPTEPQQQASEPSAPGDNALTAREGAGPSNYGLATGDGSGTRIGGRPGGGDAFAAYAQVAQACIRQAAQSDRELSKGRYSIRLAVRVDPDGRIADIRTGEGDAKRTARIREVLTGLQCSQRPPAGMPVTRVELRGG